MEVLAIAFIWTSLSAAIVTFAMNSDLATEYNATVNAKDVSGKEKEFEVTYFSEFSSLDCSYQLIFRNCSSENTKLRESVISESLVRFFEKNFKMQNIQLAEIKTNNYYVSGFINEPYLLLEEDEEDVERDLSDFIEADRTQFFKYVEKKVDRMDTYVPSYLSIGFVVSPQDLIEKYDPYLYELALDYRPKQNLEFGVMYFSSGLDDPESYYYYYDTSGFGLKIGYVYTESWLKKLGLRSVSISYNRYFVEYEYGLNYPRPSDDPATNSNNTGQNAGANGFNISFSQKYGLLFDLRYTFYDTDMALFGQNIATPSLLFAAGIELDVWNR